MTADQFSAEERDLLLAANLADHLSRGGTPSEVTAPFRLEPDEHLYGSVACSLYLYTGQEVTYSQGGVIAFGSPMMLAGTLVGSALFNRHQRNKAERQAAPQWRPENVGPLHVTNQRLAMQGTMGWNDFFFEYFRSAELTDLGIIVHFADWPVIRFDCAHPIWTSVLLGWFALGRVSQVEIPDDLRVRAWSAAGQIES